MTGPHGVGVQKVGEVFRLRGIVQLTLANRGGLWSVDPGSGEARCSLAIDGREDVNPNNGPHIRQTVELLL